MAVPSREGDFVHVPGNETCVTRRHLGRGHPWLRRLRVALASRLSRCSALDLGS